MMNRHTTDWRDHARTARACGFSLIELMVAIVVALLLLGGVIQVYLSSKQTFDAQDRMARMQEGGRIAMDFVTRDLRRAGYWGGNADLATHVGNPGPAIPAHSCANHNTWGRMIDWRVSGLNNTNGGYVFCTPGYLPGTDILTVRYSGPVLTGAIPNNDGLYLRGTMFVGWVMTGAAQNQPGNTPPAEILNAAAHLQPAVRPLISNAYYVGDSGRVCQSGDAIPALFRTSLNPNTGIPESEELVSGVEQLQVRYLLNDTYVDATAVAAADWPNVGAVRVWLLMRGECPEFGLGNDATYTMGDVTVPAAPNFRRQMYVSTVMLRNNIVR
jgi:type IV pilus assembly protein PilW